MGRFQTLRHRARQTIRRRPGEGRDLLVPRALLGCQAYRQNRGCFCLGHWLDPYVRMGKVLRQDVACS
jgi:hypothetical protein